MAEGIRLSRAKGWRLPPNAVNVARPHRWGNPFIVGKTCFGVYVVDRAHAVDLFCRLVKTSPATQRDAREELRGRDLACWCPLDGPCHRNVLLETANAPR